MKHISRIKEGFFRTTILLIDDNNKKSKIRVNSLPIHREINHMGEVRRMAKIPKILGMYQQVASDDEMKYAQSNMKDNIYNILSTKSLLAIDRAFKSGELEGETLKEFFDIFWEKDTKKPKDIDKLKVDVTNTTNNIPSNSITEKKINREEIEK